MTDQEQQILERLTMSKDFAPRVTDTTGASVQSETNSIWSKIAFRNLLPRSDVSIVTLPIDSGGQAAAGAAPKRILHFIIGGETSECSESNIVESIEWQCRRSWRMASLNHPRVGCAAALLRGVIYTIGYEIARAIRFTSQNMLPDSPPFSTTLSFSCTILNARL